jgi:hypothetical protein
MPASQVQNLSNRTHELSFTSLVPRVVNKPKLMGECVLCTVIKRKHPGMFKRGVTVLHNTCPHVTYSVHDTLYTMHWKVLDHPPHTPDPSPCDFDVSGTHRKVLKGCRFELDIDIKAMVQCSGSSSS